MMTIEEEIKHLITFLQHPAGFDVDMAGQLCIRPIYEVREFWEVSWAEPEETVACEYHKEFVSLEEAAIFFVEKRHYLCLGLDFNELAANYFEETGHYKDEPGHPNDPANCHVKVEKIDE
jgi:hypothetical protein